MQLKSSQEKKLKQEVLNLLTEKILTFKEIIFFLT